MIKAVLDTNILISALFWRGAPHKIFLKLLQGEFLNFISLEILEELKTKLSLKFKLPDAKVNEFLEIVVFSSKVVESKEKLLVVKKDSSDNKIIECAKEAFASFIVSGDKHLLDMKGYNGIKIISPDIFLKAIKG